MRQKTIQEKAEEVELSLTCFVTIPILIIAPLLPFAETTARFDAIIILSFCVIWSLFIIVKYMKEEGLQLVREVKKRRFEGLRIFLAVYAAIAFMVILLGLPFIVGR